MIKKHTAVEWLLEEYIRRSDNKVRIAILSAFEEAKEMERKQIEEAFGEGVISVKTNGKQYYNKTFKSE